MHFWKVFSFWNLGPLFSEFNENESFQVHFGLELNETFYIKLNKNNFLKQIFLKCGPAVDQDLD